MNQQDFYDSLEFKRKPSPIRQSQTILHSIRHRFNVFLQKLSNYQTRQIVKPFHQAMKQIHKLIDNYQEPQHLRIYIQCVKDIKKVNDFSTKQHQILILSYIVQVFKTNLLDPLDKPPSIKASAFRIIQIIQLYFKDQHSTVQQACARVLIDLDQYCLKDLPVQNRKMLIFLPLFTLITSGTDRLSQQTSATCISELIHFISDIKNEQNEKLLKFVSSDILSLFLRMNNELFEITRTIFKFLCFMGLDFIQDKIKQFIYKLLNILRGEMSQPKNSQKFPTYMNKVYVCNIIQKIAYLLNGTVHKQSIEPVAVYAHLNKACKSRIVKVQKQAQKAMKAWASLFQDINFSEIIKQKKQQSKSYQSPQQDKKVYNKKLTTFQQRRRQSKQKKLNQNKQDQLKFMKEDLDQLIKGGWGAQNRGFHFVKKGTGVGGGGYNQQEQKQVKNKKSYTFEQRSKQLKQMIRKDIKQNKNEHKIEFPILKQIIYSEKIKENDTCNQNIFTEQINEGDQKFLKKQKIQNRHLSKKQNTQLAQKNIKEMIIKTKQKINQEKKIQLKPNPSEIQQNANSSNQQIFSVQQNKGNQNIINKQIKNKNIISEKIIQPIGNVIESNQIKLLLAENSLSDISSNIGDLINNSDYENSQIIKNQTSQICSKEAEMLLKLNKKQSSYKSTVQKFKKNPYKEPIQNNNKNLPSFQKKKIIIQQPSDKFNTLKQINSYDQNQQEYQQQINNDSQVCQSKFQESKKNVVDNQQLNNAKLLSKQPSGGTIQSLSFDLTDHPNKTEKIKKIIQKQILEHVGQINVGILQVKQIVDKLNKIKQEKNSLSSKSVQTQQQKYILIKTQQQQKYKKIESQQNIINQKYYRSNNEIRKQNKQQNNSFPILKQNYILGTKYPQKNFTETQNFHYPIKTQKWPIFIQNTNNTKFRGYSPIAKIFNKKSKNIQDKMTVQYVWKQTLLYIKNEMFNQAFQLISSTSILLQSDDQIYILRFIFIIGNNFKKLTGTNLNRLLKYFLCIYKSNFLQIMTLSLFSSAKNLNIKISDSLNIQQINCLLNKLFDYSAHPQQNISYRSACLYNQIHDDILQK